MKKVSQKQKIIGLIAVILILVILAIVITKNVARNNQISNEEYMGTTVNASSNLIAQYIKKGVKVGGITGTLEVLDTSDATAKPEDIIWGKTAYVNGQKITGTYRTVEILKVGDYVAYVPDGADYYFLSKTYSGYEADIGLYREDLTWQVLSINTDGTVDLVSSLPTSSNVYLGGATGYNNGVYLLNDIAAKLYSNSSLDITARSLNQEDVEKHMSEEGLEYIHSYTTSEGIALGQTKTYTSSYYRYYPDLYEKENGSGINTTTTKKDGIKQSDSYYTQPTTQSSSQAGANGLTVTETHYYGQMQSNHYDSSEFYNLIHDVDNDYWLATRCASFGSVCADFTLRIVSTLMKGITRRYFL